LNLYLIINLTFKIKGLPGPLLKIPTTRPMKTWIILSTLIPFFCGLTHKASAQEDPFHPSQIPIKPTTDFDQRFYYMQHRWSNTWGYRVGLLFNDRFKAGIGGYYMDESPETDDAANSITRTSGALIHRQKIYLGTLYYEPYLYRRKLWETSLVLEAGYGRAINSYNDADSGKQISYSNHYFIPAGAGVSFNLKLPPLFKITPIRWLGINLIVGYRKTIFQQDPEYNYDGPFWSLSGAIFLDRIVEDLHRWKFERRSRLQRQGRVPEISY
jgi:hypothetical protein